MTTEDLDVYVFLPKAPGKILHKLEHIHGVRCIATLSGPYQAFAVATLEGHERLEGFLNRVRKLGDPPTAVALKHTPMRIVWSPRPPVLAFIQLSVEPGKVNAVFQQTTGLQSKTLQHLGSSIVAGDFDILTEVGGESFDEVRAALLDAKKGLGRLDGLVNSVTSFGFIRFYRRPERPNDRP